MSFVLPTLNAYIIDPVGAVFAQAAEAASVVLCLPVLLHPQLCHLVQSLLSFL